MCPCTLNAVECGFQNADRFLLHANNLIRTTIGADLTPFIDSALVEIDGVEVFAVACRPASRPVFLRRDGEEDFYFTEIDSWKYSK